MSMPGTLRGRAVRPATLPASALLLPGVLVASLVAAQPTPLTGDFMIPQTPEEGQLEPDVAADGADGFRFVWREGTANAETGDDVRTRRLTAAGTLGTESPLAESDLEYQYEPRVALSAGGDWAAVWTSNHTGQFELYGRATTVEGTLLGGEFPYDTDTDPGQSRQTVAAVGDDSLVAAWCTTIDGERRVHANFRTLAGVNFDVADVGAASANSLTGVAGLGGTRWVAAWEKGNPPTEFGEVWVRTFSIVAPLEAGLRVHPPIEFNQYDPAIAGDGAGDFVVVWLADTEVGVVLNARLFRFFDELGPQPITDTILVAAEPGIGLEPRVGMAPDGAFVVAWRSPRFDASNGVVAREFSETGAPIGDAFPVNVVTTGPQGAPAVAVSANDFVIAWETVEDGVELDVKARRFRRRALFADDFELGGPGRWSATVG